MRLHTSWGQGAGAPRSRQHCHQLGSLETPCSQVHWEPLTAYVGGLLATSCETSREERAALSAPEHGRGRKQPRAPMTRSLLPVLLESGEHPALHVSVAQAAQQGGQDGALGDPLTLDVKPGGRCGQTGRGHVFISDTRADHMHVQTRCSEHTNMRTPHTQGTQMTHLPVKPGHGGLSTWGSRWP